MSIWKLKKQAEPSNFSGRVYWAGVIDWNGRDLHGFTTPEGTTCNSGLCFWRKTALIDTVKAPFAGEMLGT